MAGKMCVDCCRVIDKDELEYVTAEKDKVRKKRQLKAKESRYICELCWFELQDDSLDGNGTIECNSVEPETETFICTISCIDLNGAQREFMLEKSVSPAASLASTIPAIDDENEHITDDAVWPYSTENKIFENEFKLRASLESCNSLNIGSSSGEMGEASTGIFSVDPGSNTVKKMDIQQKNLNTMNVENTFNTKNLAMLSTDVVNRRIIDQDFSQAHNNHSKNDSIPIESNKGSGMPSVEEDDVVIVGVSLKPDKIAYINNWLIRNETYRSIEPYVYMDNAENPEVSSFESNQEEGMNENEIHDEHKEKKSLLKADRNIFSALNFEESHIAMSNAKQIEFETQKELFQSNHHSKQTMLETDTIKKKINRNIFSALNFEKSHVTMSNAKQFGTQEELFKNNNQSTQTMLETFTGKKKKRKPPDITESPETKSKTIRMSSTYFNEDAGAYDKAENIKKKKMNKDECHLLNDREKTKSWTKKQILARPLNKRFEINLNDRFFFKKSRGEVHERDKD